MSTPDLLPWQGQIDDLRVGAGTIYGIRADPRPTGLTDRPAVRTQDEDVAGGDGVYVGLDTLGPRVITVRLDVDPARTGTTLAAALAALERACRPKRDVDSWWRLPTWDAPRRATVRVRNFYVPTDVHLALGSTYADVQLFAADGVLYGPDEPVSTGFPVQAGGLRYPLYTDGASPTPANLGYLDYGPPPVTGRLLLTNSGTADVAPWYEVTGPGPVGGFVIARTDDGRRIQWEGSLADGAVLRIDAADGSAIVDGTADRGGQLTWREFWLIAPGETVEIAFLPLGAPTAAELTAHDPSGWW